MEGGYATTTGSGGYDANGYDSTAYGATAYGAASPWTQAYDEAGNVYYTNAETGETSWEAPADFAATDAWYDTGAGHYDETQHGYEGAAEGGELVVVARPDSSQSAAGPT